MGPLSLAICLELFLLVLVQLILHSHLYFNQVKMHLNFKDKEKQ